MTDRPKTTTRNPILKRDPFWGRNQHHWKRLWAAVRRVFGE